MRLDLSEMPRVVTQNLVAWAWAQTYKAEPDACLWAAEDVALRMAYAMRIVSATVGRVGPKQDGGGMPAYRHEVLDVWFPQLPEEISRHSQQHGFNARLQVTF